MIFDCFRTERLIIRRLKTEDAETIASYRSLPEVAEFQSWDTYSAKEAIDLIEELKNSNPTIENRWFQFGVENLQDGNLIGDIGFLNNDENGKSWVGFTLNSKYWKKGFAKEAVEAVILHYFDLGVLDVWASIDPKNNSSKKLLEKLGFVLEESKPDDLIFHKILSSKIKK